MSGKTIRDAAAAVGVILGLVFVGTEIAQNTAAIRVSTSQSVYTMQQTRDGWLIDSPEIADLLIKADEAIASLSPSERLRYDAILRQDLNLMENVFTSTQLGAMEGELSRAWLTLVGYWTCRAGAEAFWARTREAYDLAFARVVDSQSAAPCAEGAAILYR